MQPNFNILDKVEFLTANPDIVKSLSGYPALAPFSDEVIDFLDAVSKKLLSDRRSRLYSDIVTFAFWIRKASVHRLKERFATQGQNRILGKGRVFHVAPSNVPVNFAYSLVTGLLTGNLNVVRVPSKDFPQVGILVDAFNETLDRYVAMRPYVVLIRYPRDTEINDLFSALADVRVIWGGDGTIAELRKSPLPPRSGEITFADRYSLAVIDSDAYLKMEDKARVAEDFYNDTFFSDQNACTSPRIIVWLGESIQQAKDLFWCEEQKVVKRKYELQPIQSVNKLTSGYLLAATEKDIKIQDRVDNRIFRISVPSVGSRLMDFKGNSGYFFEYDCHDILEIKDLCDDKRCQTVAYIGSSSRILPLIDAGVKGVDRLVQMGKTMDFDLIWDGYNLPAQLTRTITFA